jgi:4-hydroxyacetophenone monooxygenase
MSRAVDSNFIRRAVEASDLAALRAALLLASGDAELEALGPVATLDPSDHERLVARATHVLETQVESFTERVPSDAEIRKIMDLVLGRPTLDENFEVRRNMLAFKPFAFQHDRRPKKQDLPKDFSVAIIGAGPSGIAAAVQLERLGIPYVVYERRDEVGGSWSRNKYPDIRVDTLSITYEYTFDEQHPWSEYFARGGEVRDYIESNAKKFGVFKHIEFEHSLEEAVFDESRSTWRLTLAGPDGENLEREAQVVISAAGLFANPTIPDLPGLEEFQGTILHPTQWTEEHDLSGQRVAVVGNGSTGVQLLAPTAREAEQVYVFQRTPQWISPRAHYGEKVETEIQWLFDSVPGYWNWCRYTSMIGLFTWHEDFLVPDAEWESQGGHITKKSEDLRLFLIDYIKTQVGDRPDLIEKLIPDYAPMIRRPVVDNGWYQALTQENVELVSDGIARLTPTGIQTTEGENIEVDTIVFATGYDLSTYLWPADYRGQGGVSLQEFWKQDSPRAYAGMMVPRFPNFFIMYGPNSQPISGGISLPSWFQIWASYIAQCLTTMFSEGHSTICVSDAAFKEYNQRLDNEAAGLAFTTDTKSVDRNYYVNAQGRLQVNTPFETGDLYAMLKEPNLDDIDFS